MKKINRHKKLLLELYNKTRHYYYGEELKEQVEEALEIKNHDTINWQEFWEEFEKIQRETEEALEESTCNTCGKVDRSKQNCLDWEAQQEIIQLLVESYIKTKEIKSDLSLPDEEY
jgi:hypothetical protein